MTVYIVERIIWHMSQHIFFVKSSGLEEDDVVTILLPDFDLDQVKGLLHILYNYSDLSEQSPVPQIFNDFHFNDVYLTIQDLKGNQVRSQIQKTTQISQKWNSRALCWQEEDRGIDRARVDVLCYFPSLLIFTMFGDRWGCGWGRGSWRGRLDFLPYELETCLLSTTRYESKFLIYFLYNHFRNSEERLWKWTNFT